MKIETSLLPHQEAAVGKLGRLKVGALFMEQGTGKTRTALELISRRMDKGKVNAVLWLCPCSVKKNLREDIIYHCGGMPDRIVIKGIESISSSSRLYLKLIELVRRYKVFLIVDESSLCKNPFAIRSSRIVELSRHCTYKLILNGTPISKNEADLFGQFFILDWRILGYKSYYSFSANHLEYRTIKLPNGGEYKTNQVLRVLNTAYLAEKISPYTYQVKKEECIPLPEKRYHVKYFELSMEQSFIYDDTKYKFLENVDEFRSDTIYKFFTALQHVTSGRVVTSAADERMTTEDIFTDPENNPRLQALSDIITGIGSSKAIIFVKYRSEAKEIMDLLRSLDRSCVEFTGRCTAKQRQQNRALFREGIQFIVANKVCGAYGLNLQFCHNVIFYNNDFDYATRAQAEDRVHRYGQDHEVHIYDICAAGTIDDFIRDNLLRKENLADAFRKNVDQIKEKKWRSNNGKKVPEQKRVRSRKGTG